MVLINFVLNITLSIIGSLFVCNLKIASKFVKE